MKFITMLVGLSDPIFEHFSAEANDQILRTDPLHIIEAIITGVSFSARVPYSDPVTVKALKIDHSSEGVNSAVGVTLITIIILRPASLLERKMATTK